MYLPLMNDDTMFVNTCGTMEPIIGDNDIIYSKTVNVVNRKPLV